MKKKHSKYRKIWLLWVALEGLATFAIMNSFLLLRYLYLSRGTATGGVCQCCRIFALRCVPAALDHTDPDNRVSGA